MDTNNTAVGYKLWGVDNVVYGPVELPVLVEWIQDERVTEDTWIYVEKDDAWQKAGKVSELRLLFARRGGSGSGDTARLAAAPLIPGIRPGTLRRVKLLAEMTDEQIGRFAQFMAVQNARQFSEIVKQGTPGDAMYLILEGEVRVRLMIGGKESTLATLGAGECFGEITLFDQGPRSADVVANLDCVLLRITQEAFGKLVREAPPVATPFLLALGRTLVGRIRADNKRYQDSVTFARAAH